MDINAKKMSYFRQMQGLSQPEFGELLGVSKQMVSHWENGRNPVSYKYHKKICQVLNITIEDLCDTPFSPSSSNDYSDPIRPNFDNPVTETTRLPKTPQTIQNTPELREAIKDSMLEKGVRNAHDLNKLIGYNNSDTITRLLAGKLNWFPEMLGAVLDSLDIDYDNAPVSPGERSMLPPKGIFNSGAMLTSPVPVFTMADAAEGIFHVENEVLVLDKWNPETTETVAAPVSNRRLIGIRILGDSMNPAIKTDDIVLCDRDGSPSNGKAVIAKFNDCAKFPECCVCKRYRKVGDVVLLTSDNPNGTNFEVSEEELKWILPIHSLISFNI